MRYYLVAGERSGDLHASNLIKGLKQLDKEATFRGIGGDMMRDAGLQVSVHYGAFSVMGFWEVLKSIRMFSRLLDSCIEDVKSFEPDVVILVDFSGFNMRLAKKLHRLGFRVQYYIAPKAWAWNQGRAKAIKKYIIELYCILPFEYAFFKRYGINVQYVGNPLVSVIDQYRATHKTDRKDIIAILPGSRKQEVTKVLNAVLSMTRRFPEENFVVAGVDNLDKSVYLGCEKEENVKVWFGKTYELLSNSKAAIVTSGTATLEAALFDVPQLVVYRTSPLSYVIGRMVVKVPYISLVNLIADQPLVKELIQSDFNEANIENQLKLILENSEFREKISKGYEKIRHSLTDKNASDTTALLISKSLKSDP